MNQFLRGGGCDTMEEDAACETVERIVTATKKLAAINLEVCNKYVYRGTDFLPEDIGREMPVGECFSDPGFLSTLRRTKNNASRVNFDS